MNQDKTTRPTPISLAQHVDTVSDRFEADWKAGRQPRIEDYLGSTYGEMRLALLASLMKVELELADSEGKRPPVEDYLRRFPEDLDVVKRAYREADFEGPRQTQQEHVNRLSVTTSLNGATDTPKPVDGAPKQLPRKFGRFEIIELLGEGGFGAVFRARDPQLDREVALKVPRQSAFASIPERERFLREGRAAATLHHPHICPVFEAGEAGGRPYLVMALIDGKPLAKVIERGKPIAERAAASTIRKLAMALDEAHRRGIVHRDLKPANIMIDRRGQPIVMDFGLSRRYDPNEATLTRQGDVLGTPAYMAPEQALSRLDEIGPATDVYALGVVLYELVTGRRPFEGDVPTVLGQIARIEPKPPSALRPGLDSKLEAICLKAIAKRPADRFGSMRELAEALAEYLKASDQAPNASAGETQELAGLVSGLKTQLTDIAQRQRMAWWKWAAVSVASAALVLSGWMLLGPKPTTVTVRIGLDPELLADANLSFILDGEPITAEQAGGPLDLSVGDHELLIKRQQTIVKHLKFRVSLEGGGQVVVNDITPPSAVSVPPPLGRWTFDGDREAAFVDATQTLEPAVESGNVGLRRGVVGQAAVFHGGQDALTVPDHPRLHTTTAVSIAAWVCPQDLQNGRIAGKWYGKDSYHLGSLQGFYIFSLAFPGGGEWGTQVTIHAFGASGQWAHVVGVYDGQRINLYVDGRLTNSQELARADILKRTDEFRATGKAPVTLQDSSQPLLIGANDFRGLIDEVQIWDAALSAEQVASLFAKYERPVPAGREDRKVAEWVLSKNGVLTLEADGERSKVSAGDPLPEADFRVVGIDLNEKGAVLSDGDLAPMAELDRLESLGLRGTAVTDEGLDYLRELTGLTSLNLHATNITSAGLARLSRLRRLTLLDVAANQNISDQGFEHLSQMTELGVLNVWATQVDGPGLAHLKELQKLQFLELESTPVNDDGIAHVAALQGLTHLELQDTQITDRALADVAKLPNLKALMLSNTQVTDAGVEHLASLTGLTTLDLHGARVTAAGVARLKAALPNCQIVADGND